MTKDEVGKTRDWIPSTWKNPQYSTRHLACLFVYIRVHSANTDCLPKQLA